MTPSNAIKIKMKELRQVEAALRPKKATEAKVVRLRLRATLLAASAAALDAEIHWSDAPVKTIVKGLQQLTQASRSLLSPEDDQLARQWAKKIESLLER